MQKLFNSNSKEKNYIITDRQDRTRDEQSMQQAKVWFRPIAACRVTQTNVSFAAQTAYILKQGKRSPSADRFAAMWGGSVIKKRSVDIARN
jgi:hypothetical protein